VAPPSRLAAVASAENRRDARAVGDTDLSSGDVRIRRAAARALARIASEDGRPGLLRLLGDDDGEVLAFAAYGLGWACGGHEEEHVRALAARAATVEQRPVTRVAPFDPELALARALGRCATPDAEATLAAWLKGPRSRAAAAAYGLGDLATQRKLGDEASVALTQAAAGSPPLGEALYPFSRADVASAAVASRVREVATARLATDDPTRSFAIRALGHAGPEAAPELARVLTSPSSFRDAERADAAKALGALGDRGQDALAEALPSLVPGTDPAALAGLVADSFGPREAALAALSLPLPRAARAPLLELAKLAIPEGESTPEAIRRRVIRLRCAAARLVAAGSEDPLLLGCDPRPDSEDSGVARIAVLGRRPIDGPRRRTLLGAFLASPSARLRTAAFELLGAHRELRDPQPFVEGLRHAHAGTVAAAAQAIVTRADLSGTDLEAATLAALERPWAPDDLETISTLIDAAGVQRITRARALLDRHCHGASPTLRAHAQAAIGLLGDRAVICAPAAPASAPAAELGQPLAGRHVILDTDAGELRLDLDPGLAPTAAARLADLAAAGFFDGMAVHRVVPGFVVQFGDKAGDGTGGAGREPLRCETSPLPFGPLAVGVALAGRDTGSSQFFVTLGRSPHLDGNYALVGSASGDWAAVVEGDHIRKARVEP
jgi:cyclophilin family peptidyl-prolyl cis-trans isomerase/HEAT repeat protein